MIYSFFLMTAIKGCCHFLFPSETGETSLLQTPKCREQLKIRFESFATAVASISVVLMQACFLSCSGHQVTFCTRELFNCLYSLYFFLHIWSTLSGTYMKFTLGRQGERRRWCFILVGSISPVAVELCSLHSGMWLTLQYQTIKCPFPNCAPVPEL